MTSRRALIAAGLLALPAARAAAHPHEALDAERHGDVERQIMAFRAALKDAVQARDAAALRAMYAESYTHTHGSGKIDGRDARIVALLAGDPVVETAPAGELSLRVHGPDLVILTGRSPIPVAGEGRTHDFRWVQVYTRAGGTWQIAVSQATRLPATS